MSQLTPRPPTDVTSKTPVIFQQAVGASVIPGKISVQSMQCELICKIQAYSSAKQLLDSVFPSLRNVVSGTKEKSSPIY